MPKFCMTDSFKKSCRDPSKATTNMVNSQEFRGEKGSETLPPPYTEFTSEGPGGHPLSSSHSSYPLLTKYVEKKRLDRRNMLFWSLVEIVAATFSTDCQRFKAALLKSDPICASSVRIEDSSTFYNKGLRSYIEELCALVRNLEHELTSNRWILVHKQEKELVKNLILDPVDDLGLNLDYVLEVLGRYRCVEGCTLLNYRMPSSPIIQPRQETPC
jgi:hypothetical protein